MKTGTINDMNVRVQAIIGEKTLTIKELASMAKGSILELESIAGEPIELHAAGEVIARGEVVIIDENFGIRITDIVKTEAAS